MKLLQIFRILGNNYRLNTSHELNLINVHVSLVGGSCLITSLLFHCHCFFPNEILFTIALYSVMKKAFGGRVRILVEDESEIDKSESVVIVDVEKPKDDGQTELSKLGPKQPAVPYPSEDDPTSSLLADKTVEVGEVEFMSSSDSDSGSDSSEDDRKLKHAAVETASESLRDYRSTTPAQKKHRRRHRARPIPVAPSGYGTATTSRIPALERGLADDVDYDGGDSSPGMTTRSAVYSSHTPPG